MSMGVSGISSAVHGGPVAGSSAVAGSGAAGVSAVTSSISSSAAAGSSWTGTISNWITSAVEAVRNCLSKLPLIGHWFEKGAASSSATSSSSAISSTLTPSDAELLGMLSTIFPAGAAAMGTSAAVPAADVIAYCKTGIFASMSPVGKMQAIAQLQASPNANAVIVKEFYDALPVAMQNGFKNALYVANGNNSVFNGHDHGGGFGDFIVHNEICSNLAKTTVPLYIAALLQPATSSTGASSGP